jgi:hypothetical protein
MALLGKMSLFLSGSLGMVELEKHSRVAPHCEGFRRTLWTPWASSLLYKLRGVCVHLMQG